MSLADNFTPALDVGTLGYQVLFTTLDAMGRQGGLPAASPWQPLSTGRDALYDFQVNVLSGYVARGAILDQIA